MGSKDDFILKDEKSVKRRLHCQIYSTFSSHFMFWIYFDECFIDKNLLHISLRPFVNLGIGTSALELELELELILQTPLFPVPLGLWTPNLAGWWFRMRGPHPQSDVILRCRGHVTNKKRYISVFTRSMHLKLSWMVTYNEGTSPTKSSDKSTKWSRDKWKTLCLHFHKAYGPQT